MDRFGIIYRATSPSGKVYIGKSLNGLEHRKQEHVRKANNKKCKEYNIKFYRAIRKYGERIVWSIEYDSIPEDILSDIEIKTIKYYNSYKEGYNSTIGGDGISGFKLSKETKDKISKKLSGKNNPFYRKSHTLDSRIKISIAAKGRIVSSDTKSKISKSLIGKNSGKK
jgi:group I intron endonuclease